MSPIGTGKLSLTKHYMIQELVAELGEVLPGMTRLEGRRVLEGTDHAHGELADDLFSFDGDRIRDDPLLQACRTRAREAPLVVWVALLLADPRLANVVEQVLTTQDGKLDPSVFDVDHVMAALGDRKPATNFLRYFETAGLVVPRKRGGTIIGIDAEMPTSHAVPAVVAYLVSRLEKLNIRPAPGSDPVDLALGVGANHWLNLTQQEFRAASRRVITAVPRRTQSVLPPELRELDVELRRKGQVVLQGPPGVGKTHVARQYVSWLVAADPELARIGALVDSLPSHERTAERVADLVVQSGTPAVWDIVQFHPSYTYEDFVRGLQAETVVGGVTFVAKNRILGFVASLGAALEARSADVDIVLIVDEINRGDISKIFGELIYALEYRGEAVGTPYEVDGRATLTLPTSVRLIGTMNTADRSIALIDYALRRRFVFIDVQADRGVIEKAPGFVGTEDRTAALHLFDSVALLFAEEPELRDLQVGHSYFMPDRPPTALTPSEALDSLARRFAYEVYPLLLEYAAEGRFAAGRLDQLLASVGHTGGQRPKQGDLRAVLAGHLAQL